MHAHTHAHAHMHCMPYSAECEVAMLLSDAVLTCIICLCQQVSWVLCYRLHLFKGQRMVSFSSTVMLSQ